MDQGQILCEAMLIHHISSPSFFFKIFNFQVVPFFFLFSFFANMGRLKMYGLRIPQLCSRRTAGLDDFCVKIRVFNKDFENNNRRCGPDLEGKLRDR